MQVDLITQLLNNNSTTLIIMYTSFDWDVPLLYELPEHHVSKRINTAPHPTAPCSDELRRLVQRNAHHHHGHGPHHRWQCGYGQCGYEYVCVNVSLTHFVNSLTPKEIIQDSKTHRFHFILDRSNPLRCWKHLFQTSHYYLEFQKLIISQCCVYIVLRF
jgi:hypothetical protein